jgi:HD domain
MHKVIEYVRSIDFAGSLCMAALAMLAVLWIRVHWQERKEKHSAKECEREKENLIVLLQDICPIWIRRQDGTLIKLDQRDGEEGAIQVKLENIAPVWREPETLTPEEEKHGKVVLQNERAARFYTEFSKSKKEYRDVIARLLILLDKEGGCSSVVSQQAMQDPETGWDSSTYQKLGKITLLDHTLNVAELMVVRLKEEKSGHMVNDAVVVALGHDIGKLPSKLPLIYSFGDHPLTSADVVANIPEFNKLSTSKKDIILKLIKTHHKDSDEFLAKILRQSDQKARQAEIVQVNAQIAAKREATEAVGQPFVKQDQAEMEELETSIISPRSVTVLPENQIPAKIVSEAAWKTQRDIYNIEADSKEKKKESQRKPKKQIPDLDISYWFDADLCLQEIKQYINMMDGNKFQAFSMSTGIIYVQTGLIRENLLEQAKKAEVMEIIMRDKGNSNEMQPVLLAAVNIFRSKNVIEISQVGEQFFGGYFSVHYKDGQKNRGFYTPFTAGAFLSPGESLGQLEQRKKGRLAEIMSVEI